ncbi:MAG: FAD-dependent oxidoreductase [Chloroflexi bacterium]|nr:FAD-dependent oxidoreductase [Chloroflexota bacterium]
MGEMFDVLIIGGGPAGLTAAIYASRAGLKTALFEREALGGQPVNTELIENYPGFDEGISGSELAGRIATQAMNQGAHIEFGEVQTVSAGGRINLSTTAGSFSGRTLIVAGGSKPRKLGVSGEEELEQRGVFYCALCDGGGFKNKTVAVVGGGDSALSEGLYMASLAAKVVLIHRRNEFRASKVLQDRVKANGKIEMLLGHKIESIAGNDCVKSIVAADSANRQKRDIPVDGVLVAVGRVPSTANLGAIVRLDKDGQVLVGSRMETNVPGIFAAGDIRSGSPRQIATAVGDGSAAALSAIEYLQEHQG